MENPELPMIHQNGVRFKNRVAFHRDYGLPTVEEESVALGKTLGPDKDVLFMANHGETILKLSYVLASLKEIYNCMSRAALHRIALFDIEQTREFGHERDHSRSGRRAGDLTPSKVYAV